MGVFALGEGWHNNHHGYQRSALTGETPAQIDVSGYLIRVLERMGLIWNVKRPKARVAALVAKLRTEEGAAQVLRATASLAAFRGSVAVMELIHALEDESAAFRARVIETLGHIGDMRAIEALEQQLKDGVAEVAEAAEVALMRLRESHA